MKTRIQIIDDNVALTTLLAKALYKFGYDPVVENNPLLAINTARHYMPDLILLDVMMPERDGGRVLADLRADLSLRFIPVILLTGIAREAQGLADTGGIKSPILSKPVQIKELIDSIEEELAPQRDLSPLESGPSHSGAPQISFFEPTEGTAEQQENSWGNRNIEAHSSFESPKDEDFSSINPSESGFNDNQTKPDFCFPSPDEDTDSVNPW
ncbi:MAG: hypothetical protein CMO55_19105 [Verrucomicrobiales bacterium]|nr:hypothetical protein [Verrucomicrobiales bacterium]